MPDSAAETLAQRLVRYAWGSTEAFLADDVPRIAAAMSYFLLLALAPLVLVANVVFQFLGAVTGKALGTTTVSTAGAAAAAGFQQATAWAGSYAPWAIGVLVIVAALSVFAQFVDAVNRIWKTAPAKTPARAFIRQRGVALALLGVAAGAFVVALVVAAIVGIVAAVGLSYAQSLGVDVSGVWLSAPVRALVVYIAAALLFAVAFVVAPDRTIRWSDALPSALVTAALFLVGELVLSLYLGTTQRFVVFGASQFFVGLTVWLYYSAMVVLWGVELSRLTVLDAEARRGEIAEPPAAAPAEPTTSA